MKIEKFQIGQFHIDGSRCKISSTNAEVVIEPKVMDVLQYLYANKGTVVSQESIFSNVWPHSTFNPSSVQRSIALLRKALNEDSKHPQFIITHPKRGYSLELPRLKTSRFNFTHLATVTSVFLLILISWFIFKNVPVKTEFSRLVPITSNEDNESYLTLSHSGKFIAFVRGDDNAKHIWIKELISGQEIQISDSPSNYYNLGWSKDDSALAFMQDKDTERILAYVNVDKIMLSPSNYFEIRRFSQYHVASTKLQWATDGSLFFVEHNKDTNDTYLTSLNIKDNKRSKIKSSQGQDWLLTFALSNDDKHIALAYEAGQNQYRVELLNLTDYSTRPLLIVEDGIQGLSWHPDNQHLLVSQRSNLLLAELDGQYKKLDFDNYQMIRDATYNQSGQEILMELINIDYDIISKTRDNPKQYETLVDTSAADFLPVYSPDSSKFVFESRRAGLKQLFVYENGQQRMVFPNPDNEEMFGMVWSKDGKEVIAASKDKLFRIDTKTSQYKIIPHPHHSFYLREKFSLEDALLVSYREGDGTSFNVAKLDLDTLSLEAYTSSGKKLSCFSMDLDDNDRIYFANHNQVFRIAESGEIESVWKTENKNISGLTITKQTMSLKLDENDTYQILDISLKDNSQEVVFQGIEDGNMLINASHDNQEFLYLTKPELTRRLVRLQ